MSTGRILVAEDDSNIREGLQVTLESEGYSVVLAADGDAAEAAYAAGDFDLVMLDIMMPGRSGYDVCRTVREQDKAMPIIMLTAKAEEIDKVLGLQLGADDYVTKPFGVRELLARIDAVLRRSRVQPEAAPTATAPFVFGPAQIDPREYRCTIGDATHDLSARELKLIETFLAHPDEVMSRDVLLNSVWGIEYLGTTRTLDQHIAQLRKKVEVEPHAPKTIVTVHGVGYRYVPGA